MNRVYCILICISSCIHFSGCTPLDLHSIPSSSSSLQSPQSQSQSSQSDDLIRESSRNVDEGLYSRQLLVYGKSAQRKMQDAHVLVIGQRLVLYQHCFTFPSHFQLNDHLTFPISFQSTDCRNSQKPCIGRCWGYFHTR